MMKRTLALALLGLALMVPLMSAGCRSDDDHPNAVTGEDYRTGSHNQGNYDQKGHYRSDWDR